MAKVKFPSEMPSANNIGGSDKMMIAKDGTGETYQATFDQAKQYLTIEGQRLASVAPGALPAGPAGQTRYMEVTAVGTWTYGGSPVGSNAEGQITTFWWDGSAWSMSNVVNLPVMPVSDNIVEGGTSAVSQNGVFNGLKRKTEFTDLGEARGDSGTSYFVKLERGAVDRSTGALVAYTSGQPRMRSEKMDNLYGTLKFSSAKQFFIIVFDVTGKVIRNTFDSDGWVNSVTISGNYQQFKVVSKNITDSIITDDDLVNSIKVERLTRANIANNRLDALKSFVPQKDYSLVWKQGTINVDGSFTDNIVGTPITNVIYSSLFKSTSKQITASVGSGYLIGACVYNAPDYSLTAKVHFITNATNTVTVDIDEGVYIAFFVKKVDNTAFAPADITSASFAISGATASFKDVKPSPKEKLVKLISKGWEQGQWTEAKAKLASANRIRWVSAYGYNKSAYFSLSIDPTYNFDVLVFKGTSPTLKYKETERSNFNLTVAKGDEVVINIYRVDRANITPSVEHGFKIEQVDSEVNTIAFINLNGKLNKDLFSADEYGLSPDNDSNSDALNNLIEYLNRHGGGKIIMPTGMWSFNQRVWVKSGIQIEGASRYHTILRMFGNSNYSLFDNGNRAVYGVSFKNMTIDAYDHNPAGYSTDGKAFNFHYVFDSEFCDMTIRGTQGTGIGTDFLHAVKIMNNHVIECGRGWQDLPMYEGGSGIGIGTGGNVQENFIVSHNVVERCGQNGIFIEDQGLWLHLYWPTRGQLIAHNIVHSGRKNGLAARGNTFCQFSNNLVYSNVNGFFADIYLRDAKISDNQFLVNTIGVNIMSEGDTSRVDFTNNQIARNTSVGVRMISDNMKDILFQGNKITDNSKGIVLAGNSEGNVFVDNIVTKSPLAALEYSGTQKDFIHQRNIVKGTKTVTATFTGDNSLNDLI